MNNRGCSNNFGLQGLSNNNNNNGGFTYSSGTKSNATLNGHDSFDDEFSDFQSAMVIPTVPNGTTNGFGGGLTVTTVQSNNIPPPAVKSQTLVQQNQQNNAKGFQNENGVGYRLANYEVGTSPKLENEVKAGIGLKPQQANGGSLLGDEDRYSALRDLSSEFSSLSVFESSSETQSTRNDVIPPVMERYSSVSHTEGGVQHHISIVSDDVLEIVKTEDGDDADFGDFQSFVGASPAPVVPTAAPPFQAFPPSHQVLNSTTLPMVPMGNNVIASSGFSPSFGNFEPKSNFNQWNPSPVSIGSNSSSFRGQNSTSAVDSNPDSEFGDFVGCSTPPVLDMQMISPRVNSREGPGRKGSNSSLGSKSRKSSLNPSSKINTNVIAKASNLLSESPTNTRKYTDENDFGSLTFSNNSNHSKPEIKSNSLLGDLEGLDFTAVPAMKPQQPETKALDTYSTLLAFDVGAPLRTTRIGDYEPTTMENSIVIHQSASELEHSVPSDFPVMQPNLLAVEADTQSLCSLNLGPYSEINDHKSHTESDDLPEGLISRYNSFQASTEFSSGGSIPPVISTTPPPYQQPHPEVDIGRNTIESPVEDKYQVFKDEIDHERERCTTEWSKCLTCCLQTIQRAQNILTSVSSSEVVREILSNEKGHRFGLDLFEVYQVACRIYHSWKKLGGGSRIQDLHGEINASWELLLQFFIGTTLTDHLSTTAVVDDMEADYSDVYKICGVCLTSAQTQKSEGSLLDLGGKRYHTTCANLWVNQVDSILPSLYSVPTVL